MYYNVVLIIDKNQKKVQEDAKKIFVAYQDFIGIAI